MIRKTIDDGSLPFPAVIYHPADIHPGMPLIVQLHGAGEVGNGGAELAAMDVHGFAHILTADKEYPCLFAMPQCSPESFWAAEISNLYTFIQSLCQRFQIDRDRIYLTGISMGGYGTWLTACRYPDLFAAIAPVCGGGMVWKADVLKMPIWAFHGTEDDVVFPTESLNMIRKIRQSCYKEQDVRLTMLDGVAHNEWDNTYDEELLNWLLSKHK